MLTTDDIKYNPIKRESKANKHSIINIDRYNFDRTNIPKYKIDFNAYATKIETLIELNESNQLSDNQINKIKLNGVHFLSSEDENDYMLIVLDIDELKPNISSLTESDIEPLCKLIHFNAQISIAEGEKVNKQTMQSTGKKSYLVVLNNVIGKIKELQLLFKHYLKPALINENIDLNFDIDDSIYKINGLIRLPYAITNTKPLFKHIIKGNINDFNIADTNNKYVFSLNNFIKTYDLQNIVIPTKNKINVVNEINDFDGETSTLFTKYSLNKYTLSINELFLNTNMLYGFQHSFTNINLTLKLLTQFFENHKTNGVRVHNDEGNCINKNDVSLTNAGIEYPMLSLFKVITSINALIQAYNDSTPILSSIISTKNCSVINKLYKAIFSSCTDNAKEHFDERRKRYIKYNNGDIKLLFNVINILDKDVLHRYFISLKDFNMLNIDQQTMEIKKNNYLSEFIEEINNPDIRYEKFECNDYNLIMYLNERCLFESLIRHLHALSHCIAYVANIRKYIIKLPPCSDNDGQDDRFVYKLLSIDEIRRDYKELIQIRYSHEELQKQIEFDESHDGVQNYYNQKYTITLADLLERCSAQVLMYFAVYNNTKSFGYRSSKISTTEPLVFDSPNDYIDTTIQYNDEIGEKVINIFNQTKTNFKESTKNVSINRKITLFVPPKETEYNIDIAQIWFSVMLSCIEPAFHDAFFDFIYAIRYRILSSKIATAQKFYINYGKGGDGKSFMCESIKNIFGQWGQSVSAKQTNDQFNKWEFNKGFIYIEEAENVDPKQIQTYVKLTTTDEGSSRGMNELLENKTQQAIRAMNTNSPTLCDLAFSDPATVSRMVIIKFNENNKLSPVVWSTLQETFKFNQFSDEPNAIKSGPYSLFRYIIDDNGFIANEGKDYKRFSLSRYKGIEKDNFIKDAKAYKQTLLNDTLTKVINNHDIDIMKYCSLRGYNYIVYDILVPYIKQQTNINYNENTIKLWFGAQKDWVYSKRIFIDENQYVSGFRREIATSVNINNEKLEERIEFDVEKDEVESTVDEDKHKKIFVKHVNEKLKKYTTKNKEFEYITADEVNTIITLLGKSDSLTKKEIKEIMIKDMNFENATMVSVNNKKLYAYRRLIK